MLKKFFTKSTTLDEKEKAKLSKDSKKVSNGSSSNFKSVIKDLTSTKSILSKLIAIFLLLIIIPVSTTGFITANTASKNLKKSTEDSMNAATRQTSNYFDVFLGKALNISTQIVSNSVVQELSHMELTGTEQITIHQKASEVLDGINATLAGINAKVVFFDGSVLGEANIPEGIDKLKESVWYKKVQEADGKAIWVDYGESVKGAGQKKALSLVRLCKSQKSGDIAGIIIVDIYYSSISGILSDIDLGKDDKTYLLTSEGKALSAQGLYEEGSLNQRQFVKDVQKYSAEEESNLFYTEDDNIDYMVSFFKSVNTGLTAMTIVPDSVITDSAEQIIKTTIITGIIFVILAGVFSFIFSLRMSNALKSLMAIISKAEEGDLTVSLSIKRSDEIGRLVVSFNKMLVKIRGLVIQNKQAAEEVVSSSRKMASISAESSRISSEIAHAIVEVASGSSNQVAEVETSVKNVSQLADRISLAAEKNIVMETDSESMKDLSNYGIVTIDNLNKKTAQTNEITLNVVNEITQLNEYVKNINLITNVLRSIADQTNLLALNAAIEAARAGESGRGFAVVADEIRKLAEQSNKHTREIQKHIENIFKQAQSSTELVVKAEMSIREQSGMVAETAEVFNRINDMIVTHAENINTVGNMITDMDSYKELVLSSMENISAVSEEVSASTQEVSASTEEQLSSVEQLDDMAKQLDELAGNLIIQMEKFKA